MRHVSKTVICLSSAMVLSLGLLSTAMAEEATYSASEQGLGGAVTVTLTMDGEEITAVDIDASTETPEIGGAAAETLAQAILDAQSAEIDGVAGATLTSDAVKKATQKALDQAATGGAEEDAADEGLTFTPGTYSATADGYNGPVSLDVTFDETNITDITVTASSETAQVGTVAYDLLIPAIIEANGIGVDGVSGATFTGRALKTAVSAAAEEAGVSNADAFLSNTLEVEAQDPIEGTWDVVVVGGGGAGIAAAA